MPRNKEFNFFDLPAPIQVLAVFFISVAGVWLFWGNAIAEWWAGVVYWWSQWWLLVFLVSFIIIMSLAVFWYRYIQPGIEEDERKKEEEREVREMDLRRNEEIEKKILRNRLLKERSKDLEILSEEEQEILLNKLVDEQFAKGNKWIKSKDDFERVPRLTQRQLADCIEKSGYRCALPYCKERIGLEIHHIIPVENRECTNKESNLIVLCQKHHYEAGHGLINKETIRKYSVKRMKNRTQAPNLLQSRY